MYASHSLLESFITPIHSVGAHINSNLSFTESSTKYCSPFIDLPICSLMRSKYGEYKEYHNSLDQLGSVVTNKGLSQSIEVYKKIIEDIEKSNFH